MKRLSGAIVGAVAMVTLAYAAKSWDGSYAAFRGEYLIYSGSLGEEAAPTPADRKAAFMVQGDVARHLFESIGPDQTNACGSSSSVHIRQRGDLDCVYDMANKRTPYTCHFGIDLRTGKSMYGSIC
jgi:hypothetical protein